MSRKYGWGLKIIFLLFWMVSAGAEPEKSPAFINLSADSEKIQLLFDKAVNYKLFALRNPERLVIDFDNARYALIDTPDFGRTPVIAFRYGIQPGNKLRVVFDLKKSIPIDTSISEGKNYQLVIQLPSALVLAADRAKNNNPENNNTDEMGEFIKTVSARKFTVVIDAGHGGHDPGSVGPNKIYEKNITLSIAKELQNLINAQPNMKAVMTRAGDYYVGLRSRLRIARKQKADVFIAIHADSINYPEAEGASVFGLSLHGASSEAALWLAKKENYSELSGIDLNSVSEQDTQLRSVLIDLSQTATISAGLQLGQSVIKQLGEMTTLHHGLVEQAPFMVLKSPDLPSILVETGFLSNPKEETRLKSKTYQQKVAQALLAGISTYYSHTSVGKGNGDEDEKALSSSVVGRRSKYS